MSHDDPRLGRRTFLGLAAGAATAAATTALTTSGAAAAPTARPLPTITDLKPLKVGQRSTSFARVQTRLRHLGYLGNGADVASGVVDAASSKALTRYQEFFGLPATGDFDAATLASIEQPRCGVPDLFGGIAFATTCRWDRWNLSYFFETGTADTTGEFNAVRAAIASWAATVPVTFTEVSASPDIFVDWRPAADPDHSMVGNVIAHADFPPGCAVINSTGPRPLHFDDSEHTWAVGAVSLALDIESVALHELGHIIGLAHSSVSGAVMFPSISSNSIAGRTLKSDDISGAQTLYPHQRGWRWCSKCQGLHFGPGVASSRCPAGGTHTSAGSGNYVLAHNLGEVSGWQRDWRWCSKCQGLHYGPHAASSRCPAGGTHSAANSGNYSIRHGAPTSPGHQTGWRWCSRCQGHWYAFNASSSCPAGGAHTSAGSGAYSQLTPAGAWA